MSSSATRPRPVRIGVFDSGVGGLTLLSALRRSLPTADLHYVSDAAYAPYGDRGHAQIAERSECLATHLIDRGAELVVVACNTATAAAIDTLRQVHPAIPFVGIEPGLKPALAASRNRRVGVMATRATLRSARFRALLAREATGRAVYLQACVGLADAIEQYEPDDQRIIRLVAHHCAPLRSAKVDAVALGCTHYLIARDTIMAALGAEVRVVDTSEAVAAQVVRRLGDVPITQASEPAGSLLLETTGDPQRLQSVASRWLSSSCTARQMPERLA